MTEISERSRASLTGLALLQDLIAAGTALSLLCVAALADGVSGHYRFLAALIAGGTLLSASIMIHDYRAGLFHPTSPPQVTALPFA